MGGIAIEAHLGIDTAGINTTLTQAVSDTKSAAARMNSAVNSVGTGRATTGVNGLTVSTKKMKSVVADAAGAIISGADAGQVLASSLINVSRSAKGALALATVAAVLGVVGQQFQDAKKHNDELNDSLNALGQKGLSAAGLGTDDLLSGMAQIAEKAKEARKELSAVEEIMTANSELRKKGEQAARYVTIGGQAGASMADERKGNYIAAEGAMKELRAEWEKRANQETAWRERELAGEGEAVALERNRYEWMQKIAALREKLSSAGMNPKAIDQMLVPMASQMGLDQAAMVQKKAEQEAAKQRADDEKDGARMAAAHDKTEASKEAARVASLTRKQRDAELQKRIATGKGANLSNLTEGEKAEAGLRVSDDEQTLRDRQLQRALMSPAERRAADKAERKDARGRRAFDKNQAQRELDRAKNNPNLGPAPADGVRGGISNKPAVALTDKNIVAKLNELNAKVDKYFSPA